MKKIIKSLFSMLLVVIFSLTNNCVLQAAEIRNECNDIYLDEFEEEVVIDDETYTFKYYYDEAGQRNIIVNNSISSEEYIVCYDERNNEIIIDGEVVATIEKENTEKTNSLASSQVSRAAAQWVYRGTQTTTVSMKTTTTISAVAAVIASAIGGVSAGEVIARMGSAALSTLVGSTNGGKVTASCYEYNSPVAHKFRFDWTFYANSGAQYGPYSSVY